MSVPVPLNYNLKNDQKNQFIYIMIQCIWWKKSNFMNHFISKFGFGFLFEMY